MKKRYRLSEESLQRAEVFSKIMVEVKMVTKETKIHLLSSQFSDKETVLLEYGELSASTFRFDSGVCGIRLKNALGELVMLPYQGQQIWSAVFRGCNQTMRSMFTQPYPTREFLGTFGGLFQHCGATAMGGPGPEDNHPLHGELPNAPYSSAYVALGEDEAGVYIGLGGIYRHTVAFSFNYLAQPFVKLHAGATSFHIAMTVTNLKKSEMPLMYLAHLNFLPVDHSRLVYSAMVTPEHARVRRNIPSHVQVKPGYREFIQELSEHPEKHLVLEPGRPYDPEVVFWIDYLADRDGWAHTIQVHPDGTADVMRHRPEQLAKGVRWICRTADQDALGFEAGTAEADGFTAERKKGNLRFLPPGGLFHCDLQAGMLTVDEAQLEEDLIREIVNV